MNGRGGRAERRMCSIKQKLLKDVIHTRLKAGDEKYRGAISGRSVGIVVKKFLR